MEKVFKATGLALAIFVLFAVSNYSSAPAYAHQEWQAVGEHEYIFRAASLSTLPDQIVITALDSTNPLDHIEPGTVNIIRADGTQEFPELTLSQNSGCQVLSDGSCADYTVYQDAAAASVQIFIDNVTGEATLLDLANNDLGLQPITIVGTSNALPPPPENPDTQGSADITLTILNLDDLIALGPVGPWNAQLLDEGGNIIATEVIPEMTASPPGNTIGLAYSSIPAGSGITLRLMQRDIAVGTTRDFTVNADQFHEVNLSINVDSIADAGGIGADSGAAQPTCESSVGALGWFLCPVSEFLLDTLEGVMRDDVVMNILSFNSLEDGSNQQEALNVVWSGFRTIANVGFVIAFFVVVYSAASGGFLSAYDVKKLIPKLLIGAILVQLSFFICIQLVGLFNAFGAGIVDIMLAPIPTDGDGINAAFGGGEGIRDGLAGAIVGVVATLVLVLIIIGLIFSITGVFLMIVVFILRNMALIVLTVISPLAFVTWILPNTEGLFKKWWGFYIQLLAVFPIAMAFLASGRLVAYVWSSGGGSANWANQWIAMIALFAPYLLAPKMFSFAGGAIGGIVSGVNNAKSTLKERGGKIAESRVGKKARAGETFKERGRITKGLNTAIRGTTNVRSTKANLLSGDRKRALAKSRQAAELLENEDTSAATVNQRNQRAAVRNSNSKEYKAAVKHLMSAEGGSLTETDAQNEASNFAEISYLSSQLETGTAEEKRAAAKTLTDVHSNDGNAVKAVSDSVKNLKSSSRVDDVRLADRIIEDNIGSAGSMPQLVKPNDANTVNGLDSAQLHSLKAGSLNHFLSKDDSMLAVANKTLSSLRNPNEKGMVRENSLRDTVRALENAGYTDHELVLEYRTDPNRTDN